MVGNALSEHTIWSTADEEAQLPYLGITATELAKRTTELNATTYLNWDDIYLIEHSHPDSKLGSKEALALVKALDDPHFPLPEQDKIDLYNAAKKAFTTNPQKLEAMSTAKRVVAEKHHTPASADNDNLSRILEIKEQLRNMFADDKGKRLTITEVADLAKLNNATASKLLGDRHADEANALKAGGALSDNTMIKLEGLLHQLNKADEIPELRTAFDNLRGLSGHRGWSGTPPSKSNQIG